MVVAANMDSAFDHAHQRWMQEHIRAAKGERKRKLLEGLSFAENLFVRQWWEAFGNFDHLHPQYEVRDFKDGVRFIDFAYIHAGVRLCIEIDPFGTHAPRNLSRWDYDDGLDRHNDLVLDEWRVLRFSLDQLKEKPRKCQQKLQQCLGKWGAVRDPSLPQHPIDQAIVNLLRTTDNALSSSDIARILGWSNSTIARRLRQLLSLQYVTADSEGQIRKTKYRFNRSGNMNRKQ